VKQFVKFLLILLSSLVGAGGGFLCAQKALQGQPRIDSLLKELPKQKEDTNKVKFLNSLSHGYCNINPDEGMKYGQLEQELATKLGWKKGIALASNSIGNVYQIKSDHDSALVYYAQALKIDEETGYKKGIGQVNCNIGNIYVDEGDYPKALECYFNYLKIADETGDKDAIASATINVGIIYYYQSDFPKSLEYYFKALKMFEELGDKQNEALVNCNIGIDYSLEHEYQKALEYDFKALNVKEELGDKSNAAGICLNIAGTYADQKNYTMAIVYNRKALKMAEETGDKHTTAGSLCDIGKSYIALARDTSVQSGRVTGSYELVGSNYRRERSIPKNRKILLQNAIESIQQSLVICKEINVPDFMQECYENLAIAYKLTGDYKKALEAADNYHAIKDSVFSKENSEKIIKIGMKNEYDRQRLTDSLKTDAKEKIAAIKLQRQRSYTYMGIAGILLLAGFSFFIVKERGRSEKERKKSDGLLLNILPGEIAAELKTTGTTTAKHYNNVTVLFTDFVNFTEAGERMSPQALIEELDNCFKKFDEITGKYNVEKIKTIGDAYLAVAGLPTADPLHAEHVVRAAIEINAFMQDRFAKLGSRTFEIRIGIHSGSVVAGIVGVKKFAYDIWGDTVNTAARMEQNSEAGRINISATTYELVKDKIACEYRGEIEAKGKGVMKMYYVV